MLRRLSLFLGSTALTATLSLTASAQECSNGVPANVYGPEYSNGGACQKGRGPAVLTPVEAFGVHPPGPDPADTNRCWILRKWRQVFHPYYAPVAPVSTSARWAPSCYFPLMPYYTPYYVGYCPHRLCTPKPPPYGYDGGWGPGPMPCDGPMPAGPLNYGAYTSILLDDTTFWNMGGNGLVPYGTPRPPHNGPPDVVDAIQVTRAQGGGGVAGCQASPNGTPIVDLGGGEGTAITPPTEKRGEKSGYSVGDKESKGMSPAEKTAPPQ
jgi:hypothetical protein